MPGLNDIINKALGKTGQDQQQLQQQNQPQQINAEEFAEQAVNATITRLREQGLLRDQPTTNTDQPQDNQQGGTNNAPAVPASEALKGLDTSTAEGAKRFDDILAAAPKDLIVIKPE